MKNKDERIKEEFSLDELRILAGHQRYKYDSILKNFIDSGKDYKAYKIPNNFDGNTLYGGFYKANQRLQLTHEILISGQRSPDGSDSITFIRAQSEKAKIYRHRSEDSKKIRSDHLKHNKISEFEVLKTIDKLNIAEAVSISEEMGISRKTVGHKVNLLRSKGLVGRIKYRQYYITAEGKNQLRATEMNI